MVLNLSKKIFVFFVLFFLSAATASAKEGTFLVINQVRGTEKCCHSGDTRIIDALNQNTDTKDIPIAWALRYDSLNETYTSHFNKEASLGLLLEITPNLAKDSSVQYKGNSNGEDWYSAKNAFLIGYTQEERKKILDTVFAKFHATFGYYPTFTVAWMIDAYSLNYIHDAFGVRLHELTKEQYETDSYTLYGGIFNTPYYPSKLHPLIPAADENKLDLIIVRQTISDPLRNYGSQKAYFTSQPNDYLSNPQSPKNYFENLVEDILKQTTPFGLIGFENSYNRNEFGKEYLKQIEYLKTRQKDGKVSIPKVDDFIQTFTTTNTQNTSQAISVPNAKWYFGKTYRARVVVKNNQHILDDLRVYPQKFTDPYMYLPATSDFAYWIIPYVLDGSQIFKITNNQEKIAQKLDLFSDKTIPDFLTSPFGISADSISFNQTSITIPIDASPQFTNAKNLSFDDLFSQKKKRTLQFSRHPDFFINKKNKILEIGWQTNGKEITFLEIVKKTDSYELVPKLKNPELLPNLNSILQPDMAVYPLDEKKTIIYWNNTVAIAGRNPVRVFILPQNKYSRPTKVKNIKVKENTKKVDITYPKDYSYKISPWFVDITAKKKINTKIDIVLDGKILAKGVEISFAPDCQLNMKDCLTHPASLFAYVKAIIDEKKRSLLELAKTY